MKDGSWAAGLPKPTGENCPEHPTYPLVRKPEGDWCRRGKHFIKRIEFGYVSITPEMAAEWLKADEEGRPYRRAIDPDRK